jgi:hypothetical protein
MKRFGFRMMRRLLKSEHGQTAVVMMFSAGAMMALAGASLETGHIYYAYQQLLASTNAAVMAGAMAMPNTSQASTYVTQYSAQTGELNANSMLQNVTATPTFLCLSTVTNDLNVPCSTSTGASGGYNALSVTQKAKVNLWFGGLLGIRSMNLAATSTAAMRGGTNTPWNIAIVLDTTDSMNGQDSGAQCSGTQETCALQGIQILLNDLYPCALGDTCGSSVPAVDSVSLLVFPAVTSTTAKNDYTCPTSNPTIVAYTIPDTTPAYTSGTAPATNLMLPSGDTYQVIGFANDYKTTDTAASLNTSSDIVIAAGDGSTSGSSGSGGYGGHHGGGGGSGSSCAGIQAPGGEGTYYAQVIYAAQAALVAQQTPGTKNAMIILTDGNATACASNANTSAGACNSRGQIVATEGTLNGTGTHTSNPNGYESYAYPSALGECGQAVLAAQYAASAGTAVYTIGYGTPTSGSCTTDKTYSATVTTNGGSWAPGQQACQAIAAMASAQVNFYSDDANGCEATAPSNQSITKLTAIFRAITDNLSTPRMIPNGTV